MVSCWIISTFHDKRYQTYSAASLSADASDMITDAGLEDVKVHGVGYLEDTGEPLVWSRPAQTSGHRRRVSVTKTGAGSDTGLWSVYISHKLWWDHSIIRIRHRARSHATLKHTTLINTSLWKYRSHKLMWCQQHWTIFQLYLITWSKCSNSPFMNFGFESKCLHTVTLSRKKHS